MLTTTPPHAARARRRRFHRSATTVMLACALVAAGVTLPATARAANNDGGLSDSYITISPDSGTTKGGTTVTATGLPVAQLYTPGNDNTYAIAYDGTVIVWGRTNDKGQLGTGKYTAAILPTLLDTDAKFKQLIRSSDTLMYGVSTDGRIFGWGDGTFSPALAASPANGTVASLYSGETGDTFAFMTDGTTYAWGSNNAEGQLGIGTTQSTDDPVKLDVSFTQIIQSSNDMTYGISTDGTLYGWGGGSPTPTVVDNPMASDMTDGQLYSDGNGNVFAITADGTAYAWGTDNSDGQLGIGTRESEALPIQLSIRFKQIIKSSDTTTFGVSTDGTIYKWGDGEQIPSVPSWATDIPNVVRLQSGGRGNVFAITSDGTTYAWGTNNDVGQLGIGTTEAQATPVPLEQKFTHVSERSGTLSFGIGTNGALYSWGQYSDRVLLTPQRYTVFNLPSITVGGNAAVDAAYDAESDALTFKTPPGTAGTANVVISFPDLSSALIHADSSVVGAMTILTDAFTYEAPPATISIDTPSDGESTIGRPTITGTATGVDTITVTATDANDNTTTIGTADTTDDGTWSLTPDTALPAGDYTIRAYSDDTDATITITVAVAPSAHIAITPRAVHETGS